MRRRRKRRRQRQQNTEQFWRQSEIYKENKDEMK